MEELVLTTPDVVPEKVTAKYRVVSVLLNMEYPGSINGIIMPGVEPGFINIDLRNEHDEPSSYQYRGKAATDMIRFLNTANLTVKSLHKRVLEQLSKDGLLPGTVQGVPDPPPVGTASLSSKLSLNAPSVT